MKKKQLPEWLYNLLPSFYVSVGLLTIIVLRSGMAVFSGLTLMSAGGIISMLRYRYRRDFSQREQRLAGQPMDDENCPAGALVQIPWRKAYASGHPVVDAQHRRLFGLGNTLINAVLAKQPRSELEWLIDELIDQIREHFSTEEAEPTWTSHPRYKEYQEIHRSLLDKAAHIRERFHSNPMVSSDLLSFIARDVILDHISREVLAPAVAAP